MKKIVYMLAAASLAAASLTSSRPAGDAEARRWMESGVWDNGWHVAVHPSVNPDEFYGQYTKNKELWDTMFSYLATLDLDSLPTGRIDLVPGRCWIKMSEYTPREENDVNIEQHHNFIDLQYTLRGEEKMGYACDVTVKNEYNPKKDVAHFNSDSVDWFVAGPEAFYLFFPTDYHQPSVRTSDNPGVSRKLVCKIEYIR